MLEKKQSNFEEIKNKDSKLLDSSANTHKRAMDVLQKNLDPSNPPSKNILSFYESIFPETRVEFSAMTYLKYPEKIKQFFKEYQDEYVRNGQGASVAEDNIRYALGYYDKEIALLWRETLGFNKNN